MIMHRCFLSVVMIFLSSTFCISSMQNSSEQSLREEYRTAFETYQNITSALLGTKGIEMGLDLLMQNLNRCTTIVHVRNLGLILLAAGTLRFAWRKYWFNKNHINPQQQKDLIDACNEKVFSNLIAGATLIGSSCYRYFLNCYLMR